MRYKDDEIIVLDCAFPVGDPYTSELYVPGNTAIGCEDLLRINDYRSEYDFEEESLTKDVTEICNLLSVLRGESAKDTLFKIMDVTNVRSFNNLAGKSFVISFPEKEQHGRKTLNICIEEKIFRGTDIS